MKRFLFVLTLIAFLTACQKNVEYPDLTYTCDCGTVNWDGTALALTDSHYVTLATDTTDLGVEFDLAKDYYITAKIDTEADVDPHHLNMKISVPDITAGVQNGLNSPRFFDYTDGTYSVTIEDVDFNSISVVDNYALSAGFLNIASDLGSTVDQLDFEFEIILVVDGSPAGLPFIYTGSFSSVKEEI